MSVVTQLYFQIGENNFMFRFFFGWEIIKLRLEFRGKLTYHNLDIRNVRTRSRFTIFGEVCSYITRCGICDGYDFICRFFCRFIDTWAGVVFGNCFGNRWSVRSWLGRLQQFENTVVLRRTFIHLISTSIHSVY
jgi:hypothetical protein